jgi:hypothetical protein
MEGRRDGGMEGWRDGGAADTRPRNTCTKLNLYGRRQRNVSDVH